MSRSEGGRADFFMKGSENSSQKILRLRAGSKLEGFAEIGLGVRDEGMETKSKRKRKRREREMERWKKRGGEDEGNG